LVFQREKKTEETMSSGTNHERYALIAGIIISIFLFYRGFSFPIALKFFFGISILSLWFSCDCDSPNSRPIQRWWIFKVIWEPFIRAGHREILHSKLWGAPILCFIPAIPIFLDIYNSRNFENLWILFGLCVSTELHIFFDYLSSGWNVVKDLGKKRFWRKVKKAIPFF
jgi:uncharacterized metal-binding protein